MKEYTVEEKELIKQFLSELNERAELWLKYYKTLDEDCVDKFVYTTSIVLRDLISIELAGEVEEELDSKFVCIDHILKSEKEMKEHYDNMDKEEAKRKIKEYKDYVNSLYTDKE